MNYQETIQYLFERLPIYQRKGQSAYKTDVNNILMAAKILKNPHQKFKSIHIAGTNGKTSCSHMLASIFQEKGCKVGLYTSPHLKDFRERIKIIGDMIPKIEVVRFVNKNRIDFEKIDLSFFEFTVALAFNFFAKKKVDIAIIETGLGGRLDSTNIINPELSVITNIGIDHTNLLGNTIEKIAKEKAGIIKPKANVVIGRKQRKVESIFRNIAKLNNVHIRYAENYEYPSDLKGSYQKENINTVVTAIIEMNQKGWEIKKKHIEKGILKTKNNTGILGRWQTLSKDPLIICDTGHNEDGVKKVITQIKETDYNKLHIVFGFVNDKNIDNILCLLPKKARYYFCKAQIERALDASKLEKIASKHKLIGSSFSSVEEALRRAKKQAGKEDLIFIGGSTFVVAEVV